MTTCSACGTKSEGACPECSALIACGDDPNPHPGSGRLLAQTPVQSDARAETCWLCDKPRCDHAGLCTGPSLAARLRAENERLKALVGRLADKLEISIELHEIPGGLHDMTIGAWMALIAEARAAVRGGAE